ncbi:MAG: hypothetical protein MUF20_11615, partial [Methylotetracoccus sp.]|nr:hypothetical protein [Methylotetracoccus sp.]
CGKGNGQEKQDEYAHATKVKEVTKFGCTNCMVSGSTRTLLQCLHQPIAVTNLGSSFCHRHL